MKKTVLLVFLVLLLALPLVFPFFRSGYFPTHDGEWAIVRLGAMHRALMAGHFPVRWAGNLNYSFGYPLFLFAYPLPYYLGEIIYLTGLGLMGTIELLFVLSVFFSGVTAFLLGRKLFSNMGGLVVAVFYLYAPFRLVDLYVRGSLGESLAFVFFPLLFWILLKIEQGGRRWVALGAIAFAGLLLIHNVSALLFTPFLIALAVLLILRSPTKKRKLLAQRILLVLILGFGLAAFFFIPALVEKVNVALSQISLVDTQKHFVSLRQLIIPDWGYGSPGSADAFSFQLGGVHLIGLLAAFIFWLRDKRKFKKLSSLFFIFSLISLVILIFLILPPSFFFWDKVPLFSEIDFPWRVLGVATFFLTISLGYLADNRSCRYFVFGLATLAVIVNLNYARPSGFIDYGDDYYFTNEATTTSNDEFMPVWVKKKLLERPQERVEIISGEGEISHLLSNTKKTSFDVEAETNLEIQVNTIYYPGWKLKIDGRETPLSYNNERGLITFKVTPGRHQVMTVFEETPIRLWADFVSLASLAAIIGLLVIGRKAR